MSTATRRSAASYQQGHGQAETIVLFGDRHPMRRRRGQWEWRHPGIRSIYEGPGRDLAELIAEDLGLIIE
ncbi:hypothetical protein V2J52_14280 [Georgenia sp. MJ173]|uniref:hypothetical protein n=1 Tax=Georgenia sunbinii TaxID=3117728 RepID=UPI002F26C159